MQVSKRKLSKHLKKQVHDLLFQTIADIRKPQEAKFFLKDILSNTEFSVITKRLGVAYLLHKGKNYREIKESLKISSATISSIVEQLEKGEGFKIALEKIEADEWAEKWAKKIKKMLSVK